MVSVTIGQKQMVSWKCHFIY